jgi:hypothetical protein
MGTQGGVPRLFWPLVAAAGWLCRLLILGSGMGAICCVPSAHAASEDLRVRVSADYTWDDNVARATRQDRLGDRFATLTLGATLPLELTPLTRLFFNGTVGGELFNRYTGLDRVFGDIQGEIQYRSSGGYTAPIWAIFVRQRAESFDSTLRDNDLTSAGLSVRNPVTDRIFLFGAASYNQRNARNTVFDTREFSLRGTLDYSLSRRQTVYLGLEYKDGDSVSTARPSLALSDIARASVLDDVFTDTTRIDYRFRARTRIMTLGNNLAIAHRAPLNIHYRGA